MSLIVRAVSTKATKATVPASFIFEKRTAIQIYLDGFA